MTSKNMSGNGTLHSPEPSPVASSATFGHQSDTPAVQQFESPHKGKVVGGGEETLSTNGVNGDLNVAPQRTPRPPKSIASTNVQEGDEAGWGSNFWVTLVDPQTQVSFFACPATGQVSWDPPVGNFVQVLPPSAEGEWWELADESRGGIPYYYQTKTGETVWERPEGFVIPLGIIQNTASGRRLSTTGAFSAPTKRTSVDPIQSTAVSSTPDKKSRRKSSVDERAVSQLSPSNHDRRQARVSQPASPIKSPIQPHGSSSGGKKYSPSNRKSFSNDPGRNHIQLLPPIPGSPYATEASTPPSPSSLKSPASINNGTPRLKLNTQTMSSDTQLKGPLNANGKTSVPSSPESTSALKTPTTPHSVPGTSTPRARAKSTTHSQTTHKSPPPQSLGAAVELLTSSPTSDKKYSASDMGHGTREQAPGGRYKMTDRDNELAGEMQMNGNGNVQRQPRSWGSPREKDKGRSVPPPSPRRPVPATPPNFWRTVSSPHIGKEISGPILNHEATLHMSPVKNRTTSRPIPVAPRAQMHRTPTATLGTGTFPILPLDLASDIQQFSESEFARQYFSTHRTGFIFRRRVPVAQMMAWQKAPLNSPLLTLNRSLSKEAVKIFKVIQRIMGDRERDRPVGVRLANEAHSTVTPMMTGSTTSLPGIMVGVLEEERWLLSEGLTYGELRDETYCQLMKQLSRNPNAESVFKGWQFLCVLLISFPPSKNFETYLRSFIQQRTTQQEGRMDVMAKYCLRRLDNISKKGPRGKPPTIAEIETASDAAFNPSTFGESLDAIFRLQERNYPQQKVPIILPFLADGILALGGTKAEGIFRVPGDGDSVSDLKLRIDRGYYTLDGVDDPYVLASLLKLWLRELCDPLVPDEMYNECIASSKEPQACIHIVERLPTNNRRVVLFVISFLQLFLEDRIQSVTKMTPANLALVMAPNLLRCNSESMAVVFTNAQYEQVFVYNLLLHLKCNEIDPSYKPTHGLGAVSTPGPPRMSKPKTRRPLY